MATTEETPNRWIPSAQVRQYIYSVLAVLVPVAGFYGVISAEEGTLWLSVAAVVLGTGAITMAAVNTPKKVESHAEDAVPTQENEGEMSFEEYKNYMDKVMGRKQSE